MLTKISAQMFEIVGACLSGDIFPFHRSRRRLLDGFRVS
jgi:hypothetical protein